VLYNKRSSIRLSILIGLLGLLTSCSGNKFMEDWLAADPKLKENAQKLKENIENIVNSPKEPPQNPQTQLPNTFPQEIPIYPQAQLLEVEPESSNGWGKTRWTSSAPTQQVESYYQKEFQLNGWKMVQPLAQELEGGKKTLVGRQDSLQVKVSFLSASANTQNTQFFIEYQKDSNTPQPQVEKPNEVPVTTPVTPTETTAFSDVNSVSEQLRQYVEDLAALGILTPESTNSQTTENLFAPNKTVTRREYVRWLVKANNRIYANRPSQHIRLATNTNQPAFDDVAKTDPDFPYIQGLAEAGLIPSRLTNDASAALFRPNAPLTREELIQWKVPLDNRQGLPPATIDAIKDTWGFQDTAKIDPKALRSLYADFQNGEQANVRRVFGYTVLFQPKKPATRAEAAAAIWYFGYQGEGISAQEALKIAEQPSNTQSDTTTQSPTQ
jgi:S-layer homology domain